MDRSPGAAAVTAAVKHSGFWLLAFGRLRRQRATMLAVAVLALLAVACVLVPWLSSADAYSPHYDRLAQAPTFRGGHWLGTDPLGRDLLLRIMWGCRISLAVGITASLISVLIGVLWGAIAGFLGGWTDATLMRAVDILYCVPFVPFVIVLTVLCGRQLWLLFFAIGAVSWLDIARIVRGQTLSLKQREFVEAARVAGASNISVIAHHIVPNLIGIVMVYATLTIPTVILFEALLSFLGLGVQSPLASLGSLVADGASEMQSHPHLLIAPALFLAAITYCFNYLGDGLRDAFDPRDR
jgi:oligopeptide transport system permease protein